MLLDRWYLKFFGLVVLVQQASYWGYRYGRDDCLFKDCLPPSDDVIMPFTSTKFLPSSSSTERNLDEVTLPKYNKVKRGIVLTSQCSGSEWVVSSLNNVPGVTWHLERMIRYSRTYMSEEQWEQITWKNYLAELEQAFTTPSSSGDQAVDPEVTPPDPNDSTSPRVMVGFKLMYDQVPQHLRLQFASWLEEHQVHVVHLRRKCAALQFASQMDKYMRKYRQGVKKDHIYSKAEADALPAKDWEITLKDTPTSSKTAAANENRWLHNVQVLEANQEDFARYLHIYAAQTPVFEFTYESVDGPFQEKWFNALYSFLGLHHFRHQPKASKTVKTGKRTCDDRIVELGGPALPLLKGLQSRVECLRMRALASAKNTTSATTLQELGIGNLMLPPKDGRCRFGPNCKQREYGRFQDELLRRKQQQEQ